MAEAVTCDTSGVASETLERGSYVLMADGTYAKRIVIVTGGDPMDCTQTGITAEQAARGSYTVLSAGQYAQQVIDVT